MAHHDGATTTNTTLAWRGGIRQATNVKCVSFKAEFLPRCLPRPFARDGLDLNRPQRGLQDHGGSPRNLEVTRAAGAQQQQGGSGEGSSTFTQRPPPLLPSWLFFVSDDQRERTRWRRREFFKPEGRTSTRTATQKQQQKAQGSRPSGSSLSPTANARENEEFLSTTRTRKIRRTFERRERRREKKFDLAGLHLFI